MTNAHIENVLKPMNHLLAASSVTAKPHPLPAASSPLPPQRPQPGFIEYWLPLLDDVIIALWASLKAVCKPQIRMVICASLVGDTLYMRRDMRIASLTTDEGGLFLDSRSRHHTAQWMLDSCTLHSSQIQ